MFCFVYEGENDSYSRFEALEMMAESVSEIGLRHPVVLKYVDIKWRKRGFKYTLALILMTLVFHVCLMIYTTLVIGVVEKRKERTGRYYFLGMEAENFPFNIQYSYLQYTYSCISITVNSSDLKAKKCKPIPARSDCSESVIKYYFLVSNKNSYLY